MAGLSVKSRLGRVMLPGATALAFVLFLSGCADVVNVGTTVTAAADAIGTLFKRAAKSGAGDPPAAAVTVPIPRSKPDRRARNSP